MLTVELLTVVVLLGGVVGLYFTGLAITDSAFRPSHFERLLDEVSLLVAARAVYARGAPAAGRGRRRPRVRRGPRRDPSGCRRRWHGSYLRSAAS